jgi:tetratricopeptide (TPR) repeat protein
MKRSMVLTAVLCVLLLTSQLAWAQATPSSEPDPCPPPADATLPISAYYLGVGDSLFARARYSAAVAAYTCVLANTPDSVDALVRRGYSHTFLGDIERAFADYDAALALDEAFADAYTHRGVLYTRLGNFGLALTDFTLSAALNPSDPAPLVNRAIVHAIEGTFDQALADLALAESLDETYAPLHAVYGAVYSALAAQRYQQFVVLTDNAPLPAGTPTEVLIGVDAALRTGDFTVWLPLLVSTSQLAP